MPILASVTNFVALRNNTPPPREKASSVLSVKVSFKVIRRGNGGGKGELGEGRKGGHSFATVHLKGSLSRWSPSKDILMVRPEVFSVGIILNIYCRSAQSCSYIYIYIKRVAEIYHKYHKQWWAPLMKKVTITLMLVNGPWKKSNDYFDTCCWALQKVTIIPLLVVGPGKKERLFCYTLHIYIHINGQGYIRSKRGHRYWWK